MSNPNENPLEMSDEDFAKLNAPAAEAGADEAPAEVVEEPVEEPEDEPEADAADDGEDAGEVTDPAAAEGDEVDDAAAGDVDEPADETPEGTPAEDAPKDEAPAEEPKTDAKKAKEKGDKAEEKTEEATGSFTVPKSFKANGKTVELRSEEEALALMQMGANYTKKMQDLQPRRKMVMMLDKHQLDEAKLSFLIDLDRGEPEAIKKLIKDKGIDPLEIDLESAPNYSAGNHGVSDDEARFQETLEEVSSSETGKATLQTIESTWDNASKEVLWSQPEVMKVIDQQRQNGVYDIITAEIERLRTLGKIAPNTPFLDCYQIAGDALKEAGAFGQPAPVETDKAPVTPEPQKIAEKAATPKPKVKNSDKASAAAATRSSSRKAAKPVNWLEMSDDDFLQSMEGRL